RMFPWNRDFIFGEVYLWGVVVEHELGWRAQYAYPKSLVLPLSVMPTYDRIQKFCSDKLVPYDVDLYFANGNELIPLWSKSQGYRREGLVFAKNRANRSSLPPAPPTRTDRKLETKRTRYRHLAEKVLTNLIGIAIAEGVFWCLYAWVAFVMMR